MKEVLIIGYGIVGHNLAKEIEKLNPDIYDIKFENKRKPHYDFAFICVDTPKTAEKFCDISAIEAALEDNNADIFIIKSTVLPGTTTKLREKFKKRIIFSPEYYGATPHCNNFDFNFTILAGEKEDCLEVQQLLQNCYDGRHFFRLCDAQTGELVKYMENSWLATKVSFCTQFHKIAEKCGVNYEELRELFILDPRVNPSHTFVFDEHPYWDSHCLNKDVPAIAEEFDAKLLKEVIKFNESQKKKLLD